LFYKFLASKLCMEHPLLFFHILDCIYNYLQMPVLLIDVRNLSDTDHILTKII
jgi:hypothetical protein